MDETSFHELIATEDRWRGRQIYRDFMDSMKATGGTIFWGKKKKLFCRLHAEEATPSIFSAITVAEVAFSCMHIRFCLSVFVVATIMKVIDGALYAVRWHGSVTSRASHAAHSNFVPLFSFFLFFFSFPSTTPPSRGGHNKRHSTDASAPNRHRMALSTTPLSRSFLRCFRVSWSAGLFVAGVRFHSF